MKLRYLCLVVLILLFVAITPSATPQFDEISDDTLYIRFIGDESQVWYVTEPFSYNDTKFVNKYELEYEIYNPNSYSLQFPKYNVLSTYVNSTTDPLDLVLFDRLDNYRYNRSHSIAPGISTHSVFHERMDDHYFPNGTLSINLRPLNSTIQNIGAKYNVTININDNNLIMSQFDELPDNWGEIENNNIEEPHPLQVRIADFNFKTYRVRSISEFGFSHTAEIWNPNQKTMYHTYSKPLRRSFHRGIVSINQSSYYQQLEMGWKKIASITYTYPSGLTRLSITDRYYVYNLAKAELPRSTIKLEYAFPHKNQHESFMPSFSPINQTQFYPSEINVKDGILHYNSSSVPDSWPDWTGRNDVMNPIGPSSHFAEMISSQSMKINPSNSKRSSSFGIESPPTSINFIFPVIEISMIMVIVIYRSHRK